MEYMIEIRKVWKMKRVCNKIIKKDSFLAKKLIGKETKEEQERQKRGGALIRAVAHIRNITVCLKLGALCDAPNAPSDTPMMLTNSGV